MKKTVRLLVAGVIAAVLPFSGAAAAPPDRTGTVTAAEGFHWDGQTAAGTAFGNFLPESVPVPRECSKDLTYYCETTLVGFDLALTEAEILAGKIRKRANATVTIDSPTVEAYDFDLKIYESDANGTKGAQVASVGALDTTPGVESYSMTVTGDVANPVDYYLVEAIYFLAVGSYKGHATMTGVKAL